MPHLTVAHLTVWDRRDTAGTTIVVAASLFDVYRWCLAIVVGTYATIRVISFVLYWRLALDRPGRGEALARRYLMSLLARSRFRRFFFDFLQIGALAAVLAYLLLMHHRAGVGGAHGSC